MRKTSRLGIALAIGALTVAGLGLHRVTTLSLREPPSVVWKSPYGSEPTSVGDAMGLDGRHYGPLAFALWGKRLVVADSYNNRVIVHTPHTQVIEAAPLMVEDLAVTPSGAVLVADNRELGVWRLGSGLPMRLIRIPHETGVTQAIWHIAVGPGGEIVVQTLGFGQGRYHVTLNEYTAKGHLIRELSRAEGSEDANLTPLAGHGPIGIIRGFEISPTNELYILPPSNQRFQRHIDVYRWDGQYVHQITVRSPEAIVDSTLLGVNRLGWVYLGVNLNTAHLARVLVVSLTGTIINDLKVHPVPVYSAIYGRVSPHGSLYLVQSSLHNYVIDRWALSQRRVWRWFL